MHSTVENLARAKGIGKTYVSQILWLTLLAPEIVVAMFDGLQPAEMGLDDLLAGFPREWEGQRTEGGQLAAKTRQWADAGAVLVGGCCRTTPEDIGVMRDVLQGGK